MTVITAWKFDTATGAAEALSALKSLEKQHLVEFQDAAIVEWPQGRKKPTTRQAEDMTELGALGGAFWGILFGLVFLIPFFGMAVGAAMGALAGYFSNHYGLSYDFIETVRDQVTEGTSALFLFSSNATVEKLKGEFKGQVNTLIASNLTEEQEDHLRQDFGAE